MAIRFKTPVANPAEQEYLEAQKAAALAGAMPSQSAYAATFHPEAVDFNTALGAYRSGMEDMMASEAQGVQSDMDRARKMARLKELESKRNARMSDPKFRMAAMLAMAGQPGALQAMVMPQPDTASVSSAQAQEQMDALESQLLSDVYALATEKNKYARERVRQGMASLYASKFQDLVSKGAKSRMGGWDAWMEQLGLNEAKRKKDEEKARADREKAQRQFIEMIGRPETEY